MESDRKMRGRTIFRSMRLRNKMGRSCSANGLISDLLYHISYPMSSSLRFSHFINFWNVIWTKHVCLNCIRRSPFLKTHIYISNNRSTYHITFPTYCAASVRSFRTDRPTAPSPAPRPTHSRQFRYGSVHPSHTNRLILVRRAVPRLSTSIISMDWRAHCHIHPQLYFPLLRIMCFPFKETKLNRMDPNYLILCVCAALNKRII